MKLYLNGTKIPVVKTKRPSFKPVFGRSWDSTNVKVDGKDTTMYLDTTWGFYLYFQYGPENQWYKFKMWSDPIQDLKGKGTYDVNPFDKVKPELTTTVDGKS